MFKKFTVKNNKSLSYGLLGIMIFFVVAIVIQSIAEQKFSILLLIIMVVFIDVPCLLPFLWLTFFRVEVNGKSITHRNIVGISRTYDVSEIKSVIWKVNGTKFGQSEKITVKFKSHKFSVESLMNNYAKMANYITSNVEADKIKKVNHNFNR